MADFTITTKDVLKVFGIERQNFHDWRNRGYVHSSFPSKGPGRAARYTIDDLYLIEFFRRLIKGGLYREVAGEIVNWMWAWSREGYQHDLQRIDVVYVGLKDGKIFASSYPPSELDALEAMERVFRTVLREIRDWDSFTMFNFKKIRRFVDQRVEDL